MRSGFRSIVFVRLGVIGVLAALGGVVGTRFTEHAALEAARAARAATLAPVYAERIDSALWELRYGFPQFLVLTDDASRQAILSAEPRLYGSIDENLQNLEPLMQTETQKQALTAFRDSYREYIEARPHWFELVKAGKMKEAADWRARTTTPYGARAVEAGRRLTDVIEQDSEHREHVFLDSLRSASRYQEWIIAGIIALTAAFAILLVRALLVPLESMRLAIKRFSEGDLQARVPAKLPAEIGEVATVFNAMADNLQRQQGSLAAINAELHQSIGETRIANDALRGQAQELQKLVRERQDLEEMNQLLPACNSVDEAYDIFRRAATDMFPALPGALHIYSASRDQLELAAEWGSGIKAEILANPDVCWALRRGRAYIGSGSQTPPCQHAGQADCATLCVPLVASGEGRGVLHLRGNDVAVLQSMQQLASLAGDALGLALANLRLRESLRNMSIRDQLTGLFNRRYLEETLDREIRRLERTGKPLAIVMIDIDHFKPFNDSFGHEAGDAALREFGAFIRSNVRGEDIPCRYGGEEFTVVMPDAGLDVARVRAEQLRVGTKELQISQGDRSMRTITISLGVATYPQYGHSWQAVLRAADKALYAAKQEGRDRVCIAHLSQTLNPAPSTPLD